MRGWGLGMRLRYCIQERGRITETNYPHSIISTPAKSNQQKGGGAYFRVSMVCGRRNRTLFCLRISIVLPHSKHCSAAHSIGASMRCVWALPLTEVSHYSALNPVLQLKYTNRIMFNFYWDCHKYISPSKRMTSHYSWQLFWSQGVRGSAVCDKYVLCLWLWRLKVIAQHLFNSVVHK